MVKRVNRPRVPRHAVEKLGQPEVPFRHHKFSNVTIDCTFGTAGVLDVIARNVLNPEQTRRQTNRSREPEAPEETGSTGSRNRKRQETDRGTGTYSFCRVHARNAVVSTATLSTEVQTVTFWRGAVAPRLQTPALNTESG